MGSKDFANSIIHLLFKVSFVVYTLASDDLLTRDLQTVVKYRPVGAPIVDCKKNHVNGNPTRLSGSRRA
jgi:hypothetical protein